MLLSIAKASVACESPVLVTNPKARTADSIRRFDYMQLGPSRYYLNHWYELEEALHAMCACKFRLEDDDDLSDYYFVDLSTGEILECYKVVPCGKCILCKNRKVQDYCQRVSFQCEEDQSLPFFLTLTYNDKHLPADGVQKEEINQFVKKLHTYAKRFYNSDIRTFITAEYGSPEHTSRPHYHGLVFGFQVDAPQQKRWIRLNTLLRYCWTSTNSSVHRMDYKAYKRHYGKMRKFSSADKHLRGEVDCQMARCSGKVAQYITKYITKGSDVPEGKNKLFIKTSYNLGRGYVSGLIPQITKTWKNSVKYKPFLSTKFTTVHLTKYYLDKFFPTLSHVIDGNLLKFIDQQRDSVLAKRGIDPDLLHKIVDLDRPHDFDSPIACANYDYFPAVAEWLSHQPAKEDNYFRTIILHYDSMYRQLNKFLKKFQLLYGNTSLKELLIRRERLFMDCVPHPVDKVVLCQKIHKEKQRLKVKL